MKKYAVLPEDFQTLENGGAEVTLKLPEGFSESIYTNLLSIMIQASEPQG
ncbi:MAG: hypothetical protein R3E66_02100 [bacterium]